MSLFGKIKNILFEEEEIEEAPLKKENHIENSFSSRPTVEEKKSSLFDLIDNETNNEATALEEKTRKEEPINNMDLFSRSERKFDFPAFDEDEFENNIPKRSSNVMVRPQVEEHEEVKVQKEVKPVEVRKPVEIRRVEKKVEYPKYERQEEKKKFKPSPIISPVYGILDKDYAKEDVMPKRKEDDIPRKRELTIESVRKKAFGNLEDEIEQTITAPREEFFKEVETELEEEMPERIVEEKPRDIEEILKESAHEEIIVPREIEEDVDTTIDDIESELDKLDENLEDEVIDEEVETNDMLEQLDKETKQIDDDDTLEQDLFELIDSMYDDRREVI